MKVTELIETFYFLISVSAAISFYIMPDYNHGIFSDLLC